MNHEQRAALRKLAEEATPGPWADDGWQHVGATYSDQVNGGHFVAECCGPNKRGNMLHIAAANPSTILAMLDYIETLEGALQNAKDTFECLCGENSTERLMCNDAVRVIDAAMQGETE